MFSFQNYKYFLCKKIHNSLTSSCVKLPQRTKNTSPSKPPDLCTEEIDPKRYVAPLCQVYRFIVEVLCKIGTPQDKAQTVAEGLVLADYRGTLSHGLNRLEHYIYDVKQKLCDPEASPTILKESLSTAVVNGNNGYGTVVGNFCINLAMEKASNTGIGMIVANGSNHFGIGAHYVMPSIKKGLIAFVVTNTGPVMTPLNSTTPALGTNPITIGAPGLNNDSLIVDISVTSTSLGAVALAYSKGIKIPGDWAVDDNGKVTTDPAVAFKAKKLLPLGGVTSGHKGVGLGLMAEVFSGLLSGAKYGQHIRKWMRENKVANLGHGFIVVDPKFFAPGFQERLTDLMNFIRHSKRANPKIPIYIHGDRERLAMKQVEKEGGITYIQSIIDSMKKISIEMDVSPIRFIPKKEA